MKTDRPSIYQLTWTEVRAAYFMECGANTACLNRLVGGPNLTRTILDKLAILRQIEAESTKAKLTTPHDAKGRMKRHK